jgi:hypothetical protein
MTKRKCMNNRGLKVEREVQITFLALDIASGQIKPFR